LVVSPRHPFIMFDSCVTGITDRRLMRRPHKERCFTCVRIPIAWNASL
jgi:hypothetical protein